MNATPLHPAPGAAPQTSRESVLSLMSVAMGWYERAVILRRLSYEVSDLFGGESSRLLVKRLSGAAHPASESQIAAIASELRDAAAAAQEQAELILCTAVEPVDDGKVPGLSGRWATMIRSSAVELEDLDSCAVPRVEQRVARGPAVVIRPWRT
jgi:hypothetical protein